MAQLNDLLVMGQSTLLGPLNVQNAIYENGNRVISAVTVTAETIPSNTEASAEATNTNGTTNIHFKIPTGPTGPAGPNITLSGTVTKDVGGISKDTVYTNASLETVLTNLLFSDVAPSGLSISTTPASGTYEYGTSFTITHVTPFFTLGSKPITSIKIGTTSGGNNLYSGTSATSGTAIELTSSKTYNGSTDGKIYCTISDGTYSDSAESSVNYTYYAYSNLSTSNTAATSGATKQSNSNADNTYSYENGEYLWLYSRNSGKKIQQYISGTWADVNTYGGSSLDLKLANDTTATYYAYRTDMFTASGSARYRLA